MWLRECCESLWERGRNCFHPSREGAGERIEEVPVEGGGFRRVRIRLERGEVENGEGVDYQNIECFKNRYTPMRGRISVAVSALFSVGVVLAGVLSSPDRRMENLVMLGAPFVSTVIAAIWSEAKKDSLSFYIMKASTLTLASGAFDLGYSLIKLHEFQGFNDFYKYIDGF